MDHCARIPGQWVGYWLKMGEIHAASSIIFASFVGFTREHYVVSPGWQSPKPFCILDEFSRFRIYKVECPLLLRFDTQADMVGGPQVDREVNFT